MELKKLLDDFAAACGSHRKISYNLWRQLANFANDKEGCIYFLRHPDITNKNLLGVIYNSEEAYNLYIPEDPLCSTGYLNQFIYDTPIYKSCIYPPWGEDANWPNCISTAIKKQGCITLWPTEEFNELIKKASETKENKCQFKATPVQAAKIENITASKENEFVASTPTPVSPGDKINFISYDPNGIKITGGDLSHMTPLTYVSSNIPTAFNDITITCDEVKERLNKLEKAMNNKKENDTMDTKNIINFDFGPVNDEAIRLSPYGMAVHANKNGDWLTYNPDKGEMMNVNIFNFKMDKFIYKMPAPLGSIKPGDLILHQKIPMFVRSVDNVAGTIEAINYLDSTIASILPVKSPFGFNFVTKIISLIDFSKVNADNDNPFGNMLPMMLLSGDGETDTTTLCMAMMMMQNGGLDMFNPMMMYFLLKDNNSNDNLLPLMFMMQQ